MTYLFMFLWLLFAHALMDYPLQSDFMARGKNRHTASPFVPWQYILAAHALLHGGAASLVVLLFAGSQAAALSVMVMETVCHFVIDALKNEGFTNIHQDQAAHVACKAAWLLVLV